jgi:hypothetical protein
VPVDPLDYPIDVEAYRRADVGWLDELDRLSVHSGEPHQRMGTRAVDEAGWLVVDEHRDAELALRRRLWREATDEIVATLPGSEAACAEAAEVVEVWLADHGHAGTEAAAVDEVADPLVRAGLAVQDDLCLMERDEAGWRLTAGIVCFPTYWRLADKLDRLQQDVHGPVPHFREDLATKVSTFFDRLPPGRIVSRRNWGFSAHPLLFVPDLAALPSPGDYHPDRLWLRSERQTLRALPSTGAVLFTIRVQLAPATAVAARPELAARLLDAMEHWTPELVRSRGGRHGWVPQVMAWLRSVEHA